MSMVADQDGFKNALEIHLNDPVLSSSVNGTSFWSNRSCRIICDMPSPLQWDAPRRWNFDISFGTPTVYLLRDHVTLITDLISDWTSGPPSDFNTFIPTIYGFKFSLKDYRINLYLNDHNVVDHPLSDGHNTILVLAGSSFDTQLEVPSDKFRPPFRITSFWIEIPRLEIGISLPDWNTQYTFAQKRPISLGTIGFIRLDSTFTSYAEYHADHIDKFVLDIKARDIMFVCYGWTIRYFMRLQNNYFGRFTHFLTFQEYADRKLHGIIGDPVIAKYRSNKSNVFEVTVSVKVADTSMVFPQTIHDCKAAVVLSAPEVQIFVRLHNYFLEMSLNLPASTLFAVDDYSEIKTRRLNHRPKGGRILLAGLDVMANRLFGPQPFTATYLCLWEIRFGAIRALLPPHFVTGLLGAVQAFRVNFADALNAPDNDFELPAEPDLTFLKVAVPSIDLTLKDVNTAVHLALADGLSFDYNDLATTTYKKVSSVRLPTGQLRTLLRSPFKRDDWLEVVSAEFDCYADVYSAPPSWRESAAEQMRFVLQQDAPAKRLRFLYRDQPDGRKHAGEIYLPNMGPADARQPRTRPVVRRHTVALTRAESESESEALTEVERSARLAASRLVRPGHSRTMTSQPSDDSSSGGDESNKDSSPSSEAESQTELSDVYTDGSASPRWPKFEHYHHVLNRYRVRQGSVVDSPPFELVRDPVDVTIWTPETSAGGPECSSSFGAPVARSLDQSYDSMSLIRIRFRRALEVTVTPLITTAVRSLYASFDRESLPLESQVDNLLDDYLTIAAAKFKSTCGRQTYDIVVPGLRVAVLQRVEHLQDPSSLSGSPTQLLTSTNLRISQLRVYVVETNPPNEMILLEDSKRHSLDCDVQLGKIEFRLHTATSHPRSKAFIPATLLYATLHPFRATFKSVDAITASLDFGILEGTLDGQAPRVIAITFQSAIRFISKIATTVDQAAVTRAQRRCRLVHGILQSNQDKTVWTDPLSWTQASFIVKSGLPSTLRSDISWKIIAHLRHRLRDLDDIALLRLYDKVESRDGPPAVDQISSLLTAQQWTDIAQDPDEGLQTPPLIDILYPSSSIGRAIETVRESGAFTLTLAKVEFKIKGDHSMDNVLALRPVTCKVEIGRKRMESMRSSSVVRDEEEGLFIMASLIVESCAAYIQPTLIPFLSEVLRVQKRATRLEHRLAAKPKSSLNLGLAVVEVAISVGDSQLEASASKLILNVRTLGPRVSACVTYRPTLLDSDYSGCSLSVVTEEFRIGTRATPVGSRHAADQDILAELITTHCTLSILGKETSAERHVNLLLGQQNCLIHVPRSALKLYHFVSEWKVEYFSKYAALVRDLIAEIERSTPNGKPKPASGRSKPTSFQFNLSLKQSKVLLQVMHGTWISWQVGDTIFFIQSGQSPKLAFTFGLDLSSQTVDIISQPADGKPPSTPAIRVPLPRFNASGGYDSKSARTTAVLGRFDVKLKPQYVDDILTVQQKFGSDFVDLLDLYTQKHKPSLSPRSLQSPPSPLAAPVAFNATAKLEGFSISLEGPSSTQYLTSGLITGSTSREAEGQMRWDLNCNGISLSLAHHSAPRAARRSFDRRFRSAYMEIEFTADNRSPPQVAEEEQYFNLQVKCIHAVMQAAAISELGDLIDYIQAEILLRKEQRSAELAEMWKKGKMLKNKLERPFTEPREKPPSWLDKQVVCIGIRSVGVAIPLSAEEDVMPSHPYMRPVTTLLPSSVKAFLFSIACIDFTAQRYEKGELDIKDFNFQFVPAFDQSNPSHFEGDKHETHNRLRFPSMKANVHSELSARLRRVLAVANVDGLELDLGASIVGYVFSLISVYRQGKERIERIAPGQAKANLEAISARIASAQNVENHPSSATSTSLSAKFGFQSGKVRFFAPETFRSNPETRRLFRETSTVDPFSTLSPEGSMSDIGIDVINLPQLSVDADFSGASVSEKFASVTEGTPLSHLRVIAIVYSSNNTIRPSVLPFMVELVRNIERHMQASNSLVSASRVLESTDQSSEASPSGSTVALHPVATVIGGHLHAQFSLKVNASQLALTCQPDVNVLAALEWESSQMVVTIEPGAEKIEFGGNIGGITGSLRHEYLRESSVTAEARDLTFHLALGKVQRDLESSRPRYVPSITVSLTTELSGTLRFSRLQDLLCFKAVWLDRIPLFEPRVQPEPAPTTPLAPPTDMTTIASPSRSTMLIVVLAVIKTVNLEVDLGHAISKLRLEVESIAISRSQNHEVSTLSVDVGPITLNALRSLAGHLKMPRAVFKTTRRITRLRESETGQLEVEIETGDLDILLKNEELRLMEFHADPMNAKVWDHWLSGSADDSSLHLDFSLHGKEIMVIGTMQAVPYLITTAAKVKNVLRMQKQGAARESRAFRTALHPKPANPLSDVAAAMLSSARTRFQETDYDFTIIQKMDLAVSKLQLELVDQGQTSHLHADAIEARLERHLRTEVDALQRNLHLSLGTFIFETFPAPPELDIRAIPVNPIRLFTFPQIDIRMESVMHHDPWRLVYKFISSFSQQSRKGGKVYIRLDVAVYLSLVAQLGNLKKNAEEALKNRAFDGGDDWWDIPARSNSLPTTASESAALSRGGGGGGLTASGSGSMASTHVKAQPASSKEGSDSPSLVYESESTIMEAPDYQQFRSKDMDPETFKGLTGFDLKRNLPKAVHEYTTLPIESVMKLLLSIYADRLRKAQGVPTVDPLSTTT